MAGKSRCALLVLKAAICQVSGLNSGAGSWVSKLFADKRTAPDAVFCGNDQIARGVIDALRERSIFVPSDVSVVGFDNWEVMAEAARPPLTTIDMNLEEMGRETGRLLMELIGGKHLHGTRRLPCSLVIRDSCGAKRTTTN